jgi:Sulfotransferase domain
MRLNPLREVDEDVSRLGVPLVVLKPLVESQRAPELLSALSNAKAVWMYRHYRDVAASSVRTFGAENAHRDVELLLTDSPPNWRGEHVPEETRKTLEDVFTEDTSPVDAAALFWWARNMLFFQLGLHERADARLLRYEALVERTGDVMRDLYAFLGVPFTNAPLDRSAHRRALERGRDVTLSPHVDELCRAMYERIEDSHTRSHSARLQSSL